MQTHAQRSKGKNASNDLVRTESSSCQSDLLTQFQPSPQSGFSFNNVPVHGETHALTLAGQSASFSTAPSETISRQEDDKNESHYTSLAPGVEKVADIASSRLFGLPEGLGKGFAGSQFGFFDFGAGLINALSPDKSTTDRVLGGTQATGGLLSVAGSAGEMAVAGGATAESVAGLVAAGTAGSVIGAGLLGVDAGKFLYNNTTIGDESQAMFGKQDSVLKSYGMPTFLELEGDRSRNWQQSNYMASALDTTAEAAMATTAAIGGIGVSAGNEIIEDQNSGARDVNAALSDFHLPTMDKMGANSMDNFQKGNYFSAAGDMAGLYAASQLSAVNGLARTGAHTAGLALDFVTGMFGGGTQKKQ